MKYLPRIDILKGILIISVIITNFGHGFGYLVPYTAFILYSFHMPLFFAISGYLLHPDILQQSFLSFIKKYIKRLLIPYSIALILYIAIHEIVNPSLSYFIIVIRYVPLQFWFVPTLFLFLIITWLFNRLHINPFFIFCIAGSFSIYYGVIANHVPLPIFYYKLFYFIFFALGYNVRNMKYNSKLYYVLGGLLIVAWIYRLTEALPSHYYVFTWSFFLLATIQSLFFLMWSLQPSSNTISKITWLGKLGKNSYPIYLWHGLIIFIIQTIMRVFNIPDIITWIYGCIIISLFCMYIPYGMQNTWIAKYLFGEIKKNKENM